MSVYKLIFSPTGGTAKVAAAIAQAWSQPAETIDLSNAESDFSKYAFGDGDTALIAVPSFGGRVPKLAAERLAKIKGGSAKCVLVCVYGNRAYEDTLAELEDIAEDCGFRVAAAVSAVAEHSIIHQYAAGRPDTKDLETLAAFAKRIQLALPGISQKPEIPGNRPYKKAGGAGLTPKADKNCVNCGLCVKNCPAGAIDASNVKSCDKSRCISCMRCAVQCPHQARRVNGAMVSAAALALKKACSERKEPELFIATEGRTHS